ncbi:MAG: cytidylyltransferase domain-containing protein [Thermogutta sp.]
MLENLGIVDACFSLPKERTRASRKLNGKSVLEWVARRATDSQQLDGVIVVTTADPDNEFVKHLTPLDVPVFVAQATDPMGALAAALEAYPAAHFVRIETACPLFDPVLLDRLVKERRRVAESVDYLGYRSHNGTPAMSTPVGVFGEWVNAKALLEVARRVQAAKHRTHPTRYIYEHPERFRVHWIPLPEEIDRDDLRLTLNNEDDWEYHQLIFETLGPDCDLRTITHLLDRCPALRYQMAELNRASRIA